VTPHVSIVLPCRNQADHLGRLLPEYLQALGDTSFELIVVPNASTDDTRAIAVDAARRDERIRVVDNPAD